MHATKAEMRAVPIEQFGEIIERGRAFVASVPPNNLLTSGDKAWELIPDGRAW